MQPLIDADVLRYEVGFAVESGWKQEGHEDGVPPFDWAAESLDNRIANICGVVEATEPPILYITGSGNFRFDIAKSTPYKAREGRRPYHYNNLLAYMQVKYDTRIIHGMEADDALSIEQTKRPLQTIICTRDKDLRQVAGWHYGWECHNQPSFGPELVEPWGYLRLSKDRKKLSGTGEIYFFSQLLTGDPVDSIPGIDGMGAVGAFNILNGCLDRHDAIKRVYGAYRHAYGPFAYGRMIEQGRLLWMVRNIREDGSLVMWGQSE